jgi:hypothetical protein
MRKYSKEEIQLADSALRSYLNQGFTYHQAAKKVSEQTPISIITLRYRAYHMALKEGYFSPTNLQHNTRTTQGQLLTRCKDKLNDNGYAIIQEQNEIRKFMESKGSKGNPDLIAIKGEEILLLEVIERVKSSATFVNQLERYTRIGKVIVVLPINTDNIEVWGAQSLVTI